MKSWTYIFLPTEQLLNITNDVMRTIADLISMTQPKFHIITDYLAVIVIVVHVATSLIKTHIF